MTRSSRRERRCHSDTFSHEPFPVQPVGRELATDQCPGNSLQAGWYEESRGHCHDGAGLQVGIPSALQKQLRSIDQIATGDKRTDSCPNEGPVATQELIGPLAVEHHFYPVFRGKLEHSVLGKNTRASEWLALSPYQIGQRVNQIALRWRSCRGGSPRLA